MPLLVQKCNTWQGTLEEMKACGTFQIGLNIELIFMYLEHRNKEKNNNPKDVMDYMVYSDVLQAPVCWDEYNLKYPHSCTWEACDFIDKNLHIVLYPF